GRAVALVLRGAALAIDPGRLGGLRARPGPARRARPAPDGAAGAGVSELTRGARFGRTRSADRPGRPEPPGRAEVLKHFGGATRGKRAASRPKAAERGFCSSLLAPLAVERGHVLGGVAGARDRVARHDRLDLGDLLGAQRLRGERLVEVLEGAHAERRHELRLLAEHPADGELARRDPPTPRELVETGDEPGVRVAVRAA